MSYEVELKFRVDNPQPIKAILAAWGARAQGDASHVDRYFNHPSRDFRSTDEAFRIRSVDRENCITYKGAVLGTVAKTRHEIEIRFADGHDTVRGLQEMVQLLGFRFVREVRKSRESYALTRNDSEFVIAFDDVPGIGSFVEIELIAEHDRREAAESALWELAGALGLENVERRSYLDLLLDSDEVQRSARESR
jgi:adenylate cyclase class 2